MPVSKKEKLRICGDYKVTVNAVLDVEQYPLPKSQELFTTLAGGEKFSKLDLQQAYLELQLPNPISISRLHSAKSAHLASEP